MRFNKTKSFWGRCIIPKMNLTRLKTHSDASRFNNCFLLTKWLTKILKISGKYRKLPFKILKKADRSPY